MKIFYIKKNAGRTYESVDIVGEMMGEKLAYTPLGAPYLEEGDKALTERTAKPFISISDTKKHWLLLEAEGPCGLDAEEPGRKISPAIARKLHERERRYLSGLSEGSSEWTRELLSIWVRKEAYMKFCGAGLRIGLDKFSVLDENLDYSAYVQCDNYPGCYIKQVEGPEGLYCAVACSRSSEIEEIKLWNYEGKQEKTALDAAGELLSARVYTEASLGSKLKSKGYSREDIENCLLRLKELGYLDDEAYAKSYARQAMEKGHGKRKIAFDLRRKGAGDGASKAALEELESEEELMSERDRAMEQALKLLMPGEAADEKMLNRIGRKLAALGYEASVIYDVLGKLRK